MPARASGQVRASVTTDGQCNGQSVRFYQQLVVTLGASFSALVQSAATHVSLWSARARECAPHTHTHTHTHTETHTERETNTQNYTHIQRERERHERERDCVLLALSFGGSHSHTDYTCSQPGLSGKPFLIARPTFGNRQNLQRDSLRQLHRQQHLVTPHTPSPPTLLSLSA